MAMAMNSVSGLAKTTHSRTNEEALFDFDQALLL